jgi:hypothetical protein
LLVKFYTAPKQNQTRSREEGRPIFEDATYIEIMQPGNKDSIIRRPATQRDKQRFAEHFRRYEARQAEDHVDGTLLSEWPAITRAQVEELKFLNVRTVEQLVAMSDSNAQGIMGIHLLKEKAAKFLDASKNAAQIERFEEIERRNAELEAKLEALTENAAILEQPKRRGRPKKTDEAEESAEG